MIADKKFFYIDSNNRISGTHSDFAYELNMEGIKYKYASVLQANIPKSYYLIDEDHNSFFLIEDDLKVLITLPQGTYTRSSMKSVLEKLLNELSPNNLTYKIIIPKSNEAETGKYTFIRDDEEKNISYFQFFNSVYEALGFNPFSINEFVNKVLVSTNVIKMGIEDSVYIHSDLVQNGNDNILQEIYTSSSIDYGNIIFQNTEATLYAKIIASNSSNTFRFYFTDEADVPINFNGVNCLLTVLLFK